MNSFSKNPIVLAGLALVIIAGGWLIYRAQRGQVAGEQVQGVDRRVELLAVAADEHTQGSGTAPVTLIVYSDFECPFCAAYAGVLRQAREQFGDQIRIVYRHYPLLFHAYAQAAAEASECANDQGKFWEMHDQLFAKTAERGLDEAAVQSIVQTLGLDSETFTACRAEKKYTQRVIDMIGKAQELGVSSAPTTFINGAVHVGALPWEDFEREGESAKGLRTLITEAAGQ